MREYTFFLEQDYVDLGLPSRTFWASCNLGANSPEDYGDYFAWGETKGYNSGKVNFTWDTYKWCVKSRTSFFRKLLEKQPSTLWEMIKYSKEVGSKSELDSWDDAAYVNRGYDWCMPSVAQFDELLKNCYWTNASRNNVWGAEVVGPNGNSIFLPGTGRYRETILEDFRVLLWSRSLAENSESAFCLYCDSGSLHLERFPRFIGLCIRPVRASQ